MSTTQRGALIFGGIVLVSMLCYWLTFIFMPGSGFAPTLPVIVVPPEPFVEGWPSKDFMFTNTLAALLVADVVIILFVALVWRVSRGWTKAVPGRLQGVAELLGGFMYDQCKNVAGKNAKTLFPLVASIFLFLLIINWMKLLPGVESVGLVHCAGHSSPEIGISITAGHPLNGSTLWVSRSLFAGYPADEDDYHACEEYKEGHVPVPTSDQLQQAATDLFNAEGTIADSVKAGTMTQADADTQVTTLRLATAQSLYPHAAIGLSPDELRRGVVPYLFVVTPFIRGGSTDLNLAIGLALIAFVAIQVFGYMGQKLNYFQKFVNLRALGNAGKRPLGLVDFGVGLFEIVSELGKIISLSFRLFGNMFAGGILLAVMSFLVAFFLPSVFIGLEVIVTTIQAYVFAVLTLVFSAQAMEGHHGDDEEHGHDEHHASEAHA